MNYDRRVRYSRVDKKYKRKVLIDGGYHLGQYTDSYLKKNSGFEVYAFDPIKFRPIPEGVRFYNLAIWTKDETKPLHAGRRVDSSSLVDTRAVDLDKDTMVPCIDFSQWLKREFTSDDFIHLKLDIEGAEYEVLQKMMADKTIELIKELVCEWHMKISRSKESDQKIHDSVRQQLTTFPIRIRDWR